MSCGCWSRSASLHPHTYPHEDGVAVDGITVARSMGQDPERVQDPGGPGPPRLCMCSTFRWGIRWT